MQEQQKKNFSYSTVFNLKEEDTIFRKIMLFNFYYVKTNEKEIE